MIGRKHTGTTNTGLDPEVEVVLVWGVSSLTRRGLNTHIYYAPEAHCEGYVVTPKLKVMVRTGLLTEFPTTSWNPSEFQTAYCDIIPSVELYSAQNGFYKPRLVVFAVPKEFKGDEAWKRSINAATEAFVAFLDEAWSDKKPAVFIPRVLPQPMGLSMSLPPLAVGSNVAEPDARDRYLKRGKLFDEELKAAWSSAEQIIKSLKGRQRYEATYGKLARSLYVY